jgi:hypothetical protein
MRGIYTEVTRCYSGDPLEPGVYLKYVYTQPIIRHVIAEAYHRYETASWRIWRVIEKPFIRWHDRRCTGEADSFCSLAWDGDDNVVPWCGYMPFTNRQDLRCYELRMVGRRDLHSAQVDAVEAALHGWSSL